MQQSGFMDPKDHVGVQQVQLSINPSVIHQYPNAVFQVLGDNENYVSSNL